MKIVNQMKNMVLRSRCTASSHAPITIDLSRGSNDLPFTLKEEEVGLFLPIVEGWRQAGPLKELRSFDPGSVHWVCANAAGILEARSGAPRRLECNFF